ncbi:MAG: RNA methyltransferase [Isosphaeraceae bacterium]|nr:RNA methyltransferase [Isosphaeraceae bacterium]
MPRITIGDLDDPRLSVFRSLKRTNLTRDGHLFVVEGAKLLDRLRESSYPLVAAVVSERWEPRIAVPDDVPLYVAPHGLIDELVGFNFHQGVLACGRRMPAPTLETIVGESGSSTVVVCPNLTNPENLGAIVRIADVFGVDAVIVGPTCPDPLSRRVVRVSMGTVLRQPVLTTALLGDYVQFLRDQKFELVATVLDPSAEPLSSIRRGDRLALFLGNENVGLAPEWVARCDRRVTIPMRSGAESLNVAVAAGVLLYHFTSPAATGTRHGR